jgi:hypothetical protein
VPVCCRLSPQAGGKVLDAPAVEITYGLERILMSLQGVKHFKDIRYANHGGPRPVMYCRPSSRVDGSLPIVLLVLVMVMKHLAPV